MRFFFLLNVQHTKMYFSNRFCIDWSDGIRTFDLLLNIFFRNPKKILQKKVFTYTSANIDKCILEMLLINSTSIHFQKHFRLVFYFTFFFFSNNWIGMKSFIRFLYSKLSIYKSVSPTEKIFRISFFVVIHTLLIS